MKKTTLFFLFIFAFVATKTDIIYAQNQCATSGVTSLKFGINEWIVYGFNTTNTDNISVANCYGKYTQKLDTTNNYGVNTTLQWAASTTTKPSNAVAFRTASGSGKAWTGCTFTNQNFTFSHKRKGFPRGIYQFTTDAWDDITVYYINGVEVHRELKYGSNAMRVPCLQLDENSEVEIRTSNDGGGMSQLRVRVTFKELSLDTGIDQLVCKGNPVQLSPTVVGEGTPTYQWTGPNITAGATTKNPTVTPTVDSKYVLTMKIGECTRKDSLTVRVTTNPTVVTISTKDEDICYGNKVTYSGTVSTPFVTASWTIKLSDNQLISGTGSGNWSLLSTPSQSQNVTIQSVTGSCTSSFSGSHKVNLPAKTTNLSGNLETAICNVSGVEPIHFYAIPTGNYIGSINPRGQVGRVKLTSYVAGTAVMSDCNAPTNENYNTAFLGRNFVVESISGVSDNSLMEIILPFTADEFSSLRVKSQTATAANPNDNVITYTDLKSTNFKGSTMDGTPYNNCGNGTSNIVGQFKNAAVESLISGFSSKAQYVSFEVTSLRSEIYIHGSMNNSALPITLQSFTASCDDKKLKWITASEQNVELFEIYGSRDGQNWDLVSQVPAVGFSNTDQIYSLDLTNNKAYYYLKSIDFDGTSETFNPISVNCSNDISWSFYPSPVQTSATLAINSEVDEVISFSIIDLSGKVVLNQTVVIERGTNQISIDATSLISGTYIVRVESKEFTIDPIKFIKIS